MNLDIHVEFVRRRPCRYGQGEVATKDLRKSPSKEWDGSVFDKAVSVDDEAPSKMIHYKFIKFVAFNILKAKHHMTNDGVVYDYYDSDYREKYVKACNLRDNEDVKEELYKNQVVRIKEKFNGACVKDIYATRGDPKITIELENGVSLRFNKERFAEMKRTEACARKW